MLSTVENFFAGAAATLVATDYADACPIATVALEVASTSEPLRIATSDVFESWFVSLEARLVAAGIGDARARELAIAAVAALEGAFMLSRAAKSTAPMEIASRLMVDAIGAALRFFSGALRLRLGLSLPCALHRREMLRPLGSCCASIRSDRMMRVS